MTAGEKEYVVYVLIRHRTLWHWIFWWLTPSYEIVFGRDFNMAENAAKQATLKTNASGGWAVGIAAHALVCCEEKKLIVG